MKAPKVTVLMPVYNGERHLAAAIESILGQTYKTFEFLIVDDGSTDQTLQIIQRYQKSDSRIRILRNLRNRGLPYSLNRGIREAKGEYLARMDADDISLPSRLESQVKFMRTNPKIDLLGSSITLFGSWGEKYVSYLREHEVIKASLLFGNPLAHSTMMMRRSRLLSERLFYNINFSRYPCEDYEFWSRCCWKLKLAGTSQSLVLYRDHPAKRSRPSRVLFEGTNKVREKMLRKIGISFNASELSNHQRIASGDFVPSVDFLNQSSRWLQKLKRYNNLRPKFDNFALSEVLAEQWFLVCSRSAVLGCETLFGYLFSGVIGNKLPNWRKFIVILLKTVRYGISPH